MIPETAPPVFSHPKHTQMKRISYIFLAIALPFLIAGCAAQKKIRSLQDGSVKPSLVLPRQQDFIPDIVRDTIAKRDTLKIMDGDKEILIMNAIKDEDGQMVAHDVLDAAVVTARFRNVAERHGKVDIEFQVIVPEAMQDGSWQLRFYPDMFILEDSIRLDPVIITGKEYRRAQLKGYQQYERFLNSIITDSTKFINYYLLELFIERNIPQIYQFKNDSTAVSDEQFSSAFGVTEREAIDHYTDKLAKRYNKRKMARKNKMFKKYVKVPIVSEGLRLDTVIQDINGDFIYNYIQTINTRPKLRKVDVILSGEIFEEDLRIYRIPRSEPLTFYISSLSAFVDNRERYLTKVIERRAEANTACYIDFASGSFTVDEELGNNKVEIARIKENLGSLLENTVFDLDSIVVSASASPEGTVAFNDRLSRRRSEGISDYFDRWMKEYTDSLDAEKGFAIDEEGNVIIEKREPIRFVSRSSGENWRMLDRLVQEDTTLTDTDKEDYFALESTPNIDQRERLMQKKGYYRHLRESLYPRLRTVKFDFHLHRKGMVKDTVHTTELDTIYMAGVQAIRDRDYERAITILRPYNDYNTAIAYVSLDYNSSAMAILETLERSAQVNYMLAVLYSRRGDNQRAVQCYLDSCKQDPSYIHRGNLDPEIAALIKRYNLNAQPEDEFDYSL